MSANSSRSSSTADTVTPQQDPESQLAAAPLTNDSYLRSLLDQAGVTQAVLDHKYAGDGTTESPYLVEFIPSDPRNPMTFSNPRKWLITLVQAGATLSVAFASSAYSGGVSDVVRDFGVSQEVAILGVSLFVLGFAVGPLLWAPLSEMFGRQRLFFFTYLAMTAFGAAAAGAPSMPALIILRFFAGAFGSSPLTNAGGVIADMFDASERGAATGIFAMAPFLGPALGPIAGGFLGEAAGWRWVQGMIAIFNGVFWLLSSVSYPETYIPVLLKQRAAALSRMTGNVYISKLEAGQPIRTVGQQFRAALSRPLVLLFSEPIVLFTSIYMAIIYGTLYLCFAAFPIVFQLGRGWSPGIGGLAFCGMAVGMTIAVIGNMLDNKRYMAVAAASPGGMAPPEARLPPAMVGSVLIPVGMFWFAWTNGSDVHWAVPIVGSGVFGAGIVLIFLSLMTYLVDSYVIFAASVLAANSVLRSLFGAAFPLFTTYMYQDLGVHWASSIPAFLAVLCIPCPFIFYRYGAQIRMKCAFAAEAASVLQRMRAKHEVVDEDAVMAEDAAMAEVERKRTNASRASRA